MPLTDKKRSLLDRRSGEDMRKYYNLDYFASGGIERRKLNERRQPSDRRSGWMRVSRWCSVYMEDQW